MGPVRRGGAGGREEEAVLEVVVVHYGGGGGARRPRLRWGGSDVSREAPSMWREKDGIMDLPGHRGTLGGWVESGAAAAPVSVIMYLLGGWVGRWPETESDSTRCTCCRSIGHRF